MDDPRLIDEEARLAALRRLDVLDSAPEPAFDRITELVKAVLGAPMCAVSLVDRDRQWFKSRAGVEASETPRGMSFCTHTIGARAPMVVDDATLDSRFAGSPLVTGAPHVRAYAGVPLRTAEGYNIGALCVKDTRPRRFTSEEIRILEHFAALVVNELELRTIAGRDALTGALSRRAFLEALNADRLRHARYGRPSALVLFDLDHFKAINDNFGHPAGDRVLTLAAEACAARLRPSDLLGRIGGEEFGLLLPETPAEEALQCAERLRTIFTRTDTGDARLRFAASFGVAPVGPSIRSAEQWLAEADCALYAAKRAGRNRCVMAGDPLAGAAGGPASR